MKKYIKRILFYFPKKMITRIRYFYATKKILNLRNPKDFNEKIVYLMLNEFGKKEKICVDKYMVRQYVQTKNLNEILVKLYGVYKDANEIDFSKLPKEFVLKTNHGCGGVFINSIDKKIDVKSTINYLNKSLKNNYAKETLEYQYDKINPLIICEEYLKEDGKFTPNDYKIFCFNGKAKFLLVCGNRTNNVKKVYYDLNWNKLNCTKKEQIDCFDKPKNFNEMIRIAERLSEDFKFVRVDLYNINGKIYFGELTFTPKGGINKTIKQQFLDEWGSYIIL